MKKSDSSRMLCARVQAKKCPIIFFISVCSLKHEGSMQKKDRAEIKKIMRIRLFIAGQRHFQKNTTIVIPFLGILKGLCHEINIFLKAYNNKKVRTS